MQLLIADTSEISLIGLRTLFKEVSSVQVVGCARNMDELRTELDKQVVDVVLIDQAATAFGEKSLKLIQLVSRRTKIVCITNDPASMAVRNAIKLGVRSYVKKDCDVQEIIDAVVLSGQGANFFCGQILDKLKTDEVDMEAVLDEPLTCDPVTLSSREIEIIRLIVEGLSYTQIADRLHLSSHTVTTHRKNIMSKLGVNNTAALVMYAVKVGLVSPNRFLFSA